MLTAILALLEGPLGRLIMYAVGAIMLCIAAFTGYEVWKNKIENEALAQWNAQQIAQQKADNAQFQQQLQDIEKNAATVEQQLSKQNQALQDQNKSITDYLNSAAAKKSDRASSAILKETIRRMSQ